MRCAFCCSCEELCIAYLKSSPRVFLLRWLETETLGMEAAAIFASSRAHSAILHPAAKTPLGCVCSLSVTPSKLHFAAELWGKPCRAVLCCGRVRLTRQTWTAGRREVIGHREECFHSPDLRLLLTTNPPTYARLHG